MYIAAGVALIDKTVAFRVPVSFTALLSDA